MLSKGIEKIYITLGDKGALYADKNIKLYANNQNKVEVRDTIGVGDIFMAGIMYGKIHHWKHEQTLVFCIKLCYNYLLIRQYKIIGNSKHPALNPHNYIIGNLLIWDPQVAQWVEKRKYNGKDETNQNYINNNIIDY